MKNPATTNVLLLVIAMAFIAIALKPLRQPQPARAQAEISAPFPVYIEPGTQMIRSPDGSQNVYGKMVVDLSTGRVWGFPTLSSSALSRRHIQPQAAHVPRHFSGHIRVSGYVQVTAVALRLFLFGLERLRDGLLGQRQSSPRSHPRWDARRQWSTPSSCPGLSRPWPNSSRDRRNVSSRSNRASSC